MTALQHVLAQRPGGLPSAIPTVEFIDVSAAAAALGLTCRMTVSPVLVHEIDVDATVRRFRDMLRAEPRDPSLDVLRGMALMGEHASFPAVPPVIEVLERAGSGFQRVGAGPEYRPDHWRMVPVAAVRRTATGKDEPAGPADPADPDECVAVFSPWPVPVLPGSTRRPLIIVSALEDVFPGEVLDPFRMQRGGDPTGE